MSDLVMFVSKFLEIYVQYGIKATGVAPRLVRHKDKGPTRHKIIKNHKIFEFWSESIKLA